MGTLYLIATPIGNLEDVTIRALRLLREVSLVACEDTRTTRRLLNHYGIKQRLLSYNEHNMRARTPRLLAQLKKGDIGLVSEAGMPGISDPGHELVMAASASGFPVAPVPGPSAVIAAVTASGLSTRGFTFLGFLPRRAGERRRLLESLKGESRTLVAFESPHRLQQTFSDMRAVLGERRVSVCRELTKAFEEIVRGTMSDAMAHFAEPRGEFTLVIEGATEDTSPSLEKELRSALAALKHEGVMAREAVRRVAGATGASHREAYRIWLEIAASDRQHRRGQKRGQGR